MLFLRLQIDGFAALLAGKPRRLMLVFAGFLPALWALVPVHEMLHVAGCVLTGGAITRLQLLPVFGGTLLARVFPWVVAGGDYAGRLSGFEPAGDLSYLATVLLPHLVLAPLGAFVCRVATRRDSPLLWGLGLAGAAQPIASLLGDFYEAASIPITATARALGAGWAPTLRGDDVTLVFEAAAKLESPLAFAVVALGCLLGAGLAAALLRLSGGVAARSTASAR